MRGHPNQLLSISQRMALYTQKTDSCWIWTGSKWRGGYGNVCVGRGRARSTHRVAYELAHGVSLLPSQLVLHKCDVPACVNPDHLFLGTHQDNSDDCKRKNRQTKGEAATSARTTEAIVIEIRRIWFSEPPPIHYNGPNTLIELGKRFGLSPGAVHNIVLGKTWKHVEGAVCRRS